MDGLHAEPLGNYAVGDAITLPPSVAAAAASKKEAAAAVYLGCALRCALLLPCLKQRKPQPLSPLCVQMVSLAWYSSLGQCMPGCSVGTCTTPLTTHLPHPMSSQTNNDLGVWGVEL